MKQNLPEPEWRMQQGFVIVTFKRPPYGVEPGNCAPSAGQVGLKQDSSKTQASDKYKPSSAYVEDVVNYIPDGEEYSLVEIMGFCNKRSRKKFSSYYLIPSIKDGAIKRKYPDQPNHPRQRYRLTKKLSSGREGSEMLSLVQTNSKMCPTAVEWVRKWGVLFPIGNC